MQLRFTILSVAAVLVASRLAVAADFLELYSTDKPLAVKSATVGRDDVTIVDRNNMERKVPVADIRWIRFDREPNDLSDAKEQIRRSGKYAESLQVLEKIKKNDLSSPQMSADHDFYIALCQAKLALVGKGQTKAARARLAAFIKASPQHYTYYEANELLGDLARAEKDYAAAIASYGEMIKNKDLKTRAAVLAGWTRLEEGQTAAASKAFDVALADKSTGPGPDAQRRLASLGKAACLAETDKSADAVKLIEEIIEKSPPDALNARIYNVLGGAQLKNKQPKAAVMAYLHVDLMYAQDPAEHAEALGNLKALWPQVGHAERGQEASKRLARLYPASRWAQN